MCGNLICVLVDSFSRLAFWWRKRFVFKLFLIADRRLVFSRGYIKIHVAKCLLQSRTGLVILFLSAATFIWGIPENKYELWGYIKSNKNVRKTPASRTMNLELCKFPRMHLTHFRLVQRQSATVTAHACALSWHSPFNAGHALSSMFPLGLVSFEKLKAGHHHLLSTTLKCIQGSS